jgi:hypothetical protein
MVAVRDFELAGSASALQVGAAEGVGLYSAVPSAIAVIREHQAAAAAAMKAAGKAAKKAAPAGKAHKVMKAAAARKVWTAKMATAKKAAAAAVAAAKEAAAVAATAATAEAEASVAGVCDVPVTPARLRWPLAKNQKQCIICNRIIHFSQRIWKKGWAGCGASCTHPDIQLPHLHHSLEVHTLPDKFGARSTRAGWYK